jgi:DNA ligase (NAD+)
MAYVNQLGIDVGAEILVARANDVIPRVERVIKKTGTVWKAPKQCPSCGGKTEMRGEHLICTNSSLCPAQVTGRIKNWISGNNILEWGDTIITRLVESGKVRTINDLYQLTEQDLSSMERMGDKSAKKLIGLLHANKELSLEKLIGNLSIYMVGETVVGLAVEAGFNTVKKLYDAKLSQLSSIPGLGPTKATALYEGLRANGALVNELLTVCDIKIKEKTGVLVGKSFCFTGAMKNKRPLLEKMVTDNGGTTKSSVGKGLNYLVIADPNSTSSKAVAARKNGTKCISEEAFLAMVK